MIATAVQRAITSNLSRMANGTQLRGDLRSYADRMLDETAVLPMSADGLPKYAPSLSQINSNDPRRSEFVRY